jgi:hypothetical protein
MFKDIDVLFALGQHAYFHFYSVSSQDQQFVIDMSPKSDTFSRFRGSQSLLLFLIVAFEIEAMCVSILHAPVVRTKRILYMEREKIILPQYMILFPCFIKVNFAQVSAIISIPYICIANKTASQNIVQLETDVIFFVNFNQYGHTNTLDTNK